MARSNGTGALYYLPQRDLWKVVIDTPPVNGKRVQWSSTNRNQAVALERLNAKRAELIASGFLEDREPRAPRTRYEWLKEARKLGTHTPGEFAQMWATMPDACPDCSVPLDIFNPVVDHIIPITRGGSDVIGNLRIVCWECNGEKRESMSWRYAGPIPRPYRGMPTKLEAHARGAWS